MKASKNKNLDLTFEFGITNLSEFHVNEKHKIYVLTV